MSTIQIIKAGLISAALTLTIAASAGESTTEKVGNSVDKAGDSVKRGYRKIKDKSCEMVNGKMECAAKKVGNKMRNATDSIKTKAKEVKNKVD